MKKSLVFVLAAVLGIYILGCKKNDEAKPENQDPMSMNALSTLSNESAGTAAPQQAAQVPGTKTEVPKETSVSTAVPAANLEPLPPQGPYKPSAIDVQTSLKNAGVYNGTVDGKMGPMTKKAIEEFQKANGLNADGKVGPKTWGLLSKYKSLKVPAAPVTAKPKK